MKRIKKFAALLLSLAIVLSATVLTAVPVSAASNPFPSSQTISGITTVPCTYYAWQQAYDRLGVALPNWGNAINWLDRAASAGYSTGNTARANSIAVWRSTAHSYGHVSYVTAVNGSKMTVNEGGMTSNGGAANGTGIIVGNNVSSVVGTAKGNGSTSVLLGFIYLTEAPSVSITHALIDNECWETDNNVFVAYNLNKPSSYTVSNIGVRFRKEGQSYSGDKQHIQSTEAGNHSGKSSVHITWDFKDELGWTLTHATKYYYQLYAKVEGKEYWSDEYSVTTTGNHKFVWVTDKAADCGNTGIKHEECSVCDAVRNENTVISAAGNHKFVWVTDKAADCGNTGVKHEECSVCDEVRSENTVISATGNHKHDNACDTTCNVCGTIRKVGSHKYTNDADTSCDYCEAKAYPGGNTLVNENGTWYHIVNRQKVNDTTLVNYGGSWYYVQNGVLKWGVETLVNYYGTWYYVKNSTVDFKAETLCNYYGTWYYVKNGVVDWSANTLVNYGGSWYYVQNGQLKWGVETLVNYYGSWYYVKNSTVDFKAETLCNYYGTWYYVKNGVVKWNAKTLVKYGKDWYYVQNGQLKWGVETLVNYGGSWYYVKNSTVDFKANLKFNYYGTYYNVVNGVVKF